VGLSRPPAALTGQNGRAGTKIPDAMGIFCYSGLLSGRQGAWAMTDLQTFGGKVRYIRLRGQKVLSGGKMSFAIERETNLPAHLTSKGGLVFSEVGAGIYPIAIVATSHQDIKMALHSSDAHIYIDQTSKDLRAEGFEICFKLTAFNEMKTLEIHDATRDVIKNVGSFVTGSMPLSLGSQALDGTRKAVGAGLGAKNAAGMSKGVVAKIHDAYGEKGTKTDKIGIVLHMYPIKGYTSTGAKSITLHELARRAYS
jgi:hypothetical protein